MDTVSKIREIVIINPEERTSVVQILLKYFNGVGLSTLRNQVPALVYRPPSIIAIARTLALAPPALTTRII
jgi:hypothetical protein